MQINKYKNGLSSGWFSESKRHSNARKFGVAGGLYANRNAQNYMKQKIIGFIMNDLSGSEQEEILRSKKNEMDEDYLERLQNKLEKMSLNSLESEMNKSGHTYKDSELYAKKRKDYIKGGIGDKTDISKLNQEELKKGVKVEMEHTSNPKIAREIASDHITEFPKGYYEQLDKMEKNLKKINRTMSMREFHINSLKKKGYLKRGLKDLNDDTIKKLYDMER